MYGKRRPEMEWRFPCNLVHLVVEPRFPVYTAES